MSRLRLLGGVRSVGVRFGRGKGGGVDGGNGRKGVGKGKEWRRTKKRMITR